MAQEHKHGAMDTEVQEKTFAGFINWTTKTVIICILALVFIGKMICTTFFKYFIAVNDTDV